MATVWALLAFLLALTAHGRSRPRLRAVHLSGKWTAEPHQLLAALDYLVDQEHADLIRLTEVSPAKFREPLRKWARGRGWHLHHPRAAGRNECAILSRRRILGRGSFRATKLRLRVGRTAPTFVIFCRVRGWGWFAVLHTPAHTGGLRTDREHAWPTRVYHSIFDGIGSFWLRTRRRQTWSMDANLDARLARNRERIHGWFPDLTLAAPKDQHPTEGGRVIDLEVTNLEVVEASRTLHGFPGLDHRPELTILGRAAA